MQALVPPSESSDAYPNSIQGTTTSRNVPIREWIMEDIKLRRRDVLKGVIAGSALATTPLRTIAAPAVLKGTPKGEIVVWNFRGNNADDIWQYPFYTEFAQQTGYKVNVQNRPWDSQRTDILAALAGGRVPDLFKGHSKYVGEFGANGVLQALDEIDGWAEYSSQFIPAYVDQLKYKGKQYGAPYSTGAFVLAGNKSLMEAAGVASPTTWSELKASAAKATNTGKGVYGIVLPGGANQDSAYRWCAWLYKAGGRVLDDEWTKPIFNSEAGVATLALWVDLKKAGSLPPGVPAYGYNDEAQFFGLGKAVFASEGNWWQRAMEDGYKFPSSNLVLSPLPAADGVKGVAPAETLSDLNMFGMFKDGPNTAGAWELMKFARSTKADLALATTGGEAIPVTKAAYEPGVNWRLYGKDIFLKEAPASVLWPSHPNITEIQVILGEAINAALTGSMTPKEALDAAAAKTADVIG